MNSKNLGGIGALMASAGMLIPYTGGAIVLAGLIILLIAYYNISKEFKRKQIWQSILIWFLFGVISFLFLTGFGLTSFLSLTSLAAKDQASFLKFLIPSIIFGLIAYTSFIIAGWHFYKTNQLTAKVYKQNIFRTAGLLEWIGALTSIIGLGLVVSWIAKIVLVVAFFSEKNQK